MEINLPLCSASTIDHLRVNVGSLGRLKLSSPYPMEMRAWGGWNAAFLQRYWWHAVIAQQVSVTIWHCLPQWSCSTEHSLLMELLSRTESFFLPCWFIILASMCQASYSNFEFPFALNLYACPMDLGYCYLMKDTQVTELISPSVMIQCCISLPANTSILLGCNISSIWLPDMLHCFISRLFSTGKNYIQLFLYSLGVHLNSNMRKKAVCSQCCLTLI